MKLNTKNILLIMIGSILLIPIVIAFEVNEYEYFSDIKVHCEEYKGYVKFELPNQYFSSKTPNSYMEIEHYIEKNIGGGSYNKQSNWFVKQIENQPVTNVEKIFDNNHNTYLVSQDSESIEFTFENPNIQSIEKVSIDLRDSSIKSISLYNNNEKVDFVENINNFHYEIFFNNPINSDSLRFVLEYDDIIKIKEVSFFNYQNYNDKSFVYFYVDNNCDKNFRFYFGEYGENNARTGSKNLPVEFDITINSYKNSLYEEDFDEDSIKNNDDNCLYISNTDQKDINYNNIGDACEDDDRDGVKNAIDNCPDKYNRDQLDGDDDGIGNVCDSVDGRFLEQNKYLVFIFAAIIAIIFIIVSIILMRKKD